MILNRSPYYYNVSLPNSYVTSVDFTVEVGTGSSSSPVVVQTYEVTKPVPSSSSPNSFIDISPFVRDVYEFAPLNFSGVSSNTIQASGNKAVLIAEVTAAFNDTIGSNSADENDTYICTLGYGKYRDGQNLSPTDKILLTHSDYKADTRGHFVVPLQCASGDSNPTVNGVAVTLGFSDTNTNYVKYLVIPVGNYSSTITVVFGGETITIEPTDECKYDLTQVQFLNRYGVIEVIHFYKASRQTFQIEGERFKNNFTNGSSYDTDIHQLKKYNVKGNRRVRIETGFLNEEYNDTIEELLLSEYVWLNGVPVNVSTNTLEQKTRIVDKLINYSIEFEYAFDEISNV